MTAFLVKEGIDTNQYAIGFTEQFYDLLSEWNCGGSYNVIPSRLLGFSYVDYIKYMQVNYKAKYRGSRGFGSLYFTLKEDCSAAIKKLNNIWFEVEELFVKNVEFTENDIPISY